MCYKRKDYGKFNRRRFPEDLGKPALTFSRREEVHNCKKICWMICTARTSILSNKRKVIAWVIKNKLKNHRGKEILT
jgi:hypothetical protein